MKASLKNRIEKLEAYRKKREQKGCFISAHSDEDAEQQISKYRAEHGDGGVFFIMHWGGGEAHEKSCEPN